MDELKTFFKSNLSIADVICYHKSSNHLSAGPKSMNRFPFISHFIEFDIRKTSEKSCKHDQFVCMRYIFDEVGCKFVKGRKPSTFLSIDETLYLYRGHISFKQHNPSKRA